MKKILVLAPHEDRAGRASLLAGQLAERTGASITLLRVLEEKLGTGSPSDETRSGRQIRELLLEVETRQVEELASRLRIDGREVSVEVCWGVPWEAVLDRVDRDGFDLVVKPANGLSRKGRVFFGSTALHLFRRCKCPVWVVGDDGRLPEKLVAAVDPTGAIHRRKIAGGILDWADRIGAWSGTQIHVATAWNAPAADLLRENLPEDDWKTYVEEARERVERDLRSLLASRRTAIPDDHVHLIEGIAFEVLPELAEDQDIDLIVMGTLNREGEVGDLLGETAETIIRAVHCSVLTIPPVQPTVL